MKKRLIAILLCTALALSNVTCIFSYASKYDNAEEILIVEGKKYYLDAEGRLLNKEAGLPSGYHLNEQGQLIDDNVYPNMVTLPADRNIHDRTQYPLSGLREELHLEEERINVLRPYDWSFMSEGVDKWDFYNFHSIMHPGSASGGWIFVYLLSGEEPAGYEKRLISPWYSKTVEEANAIIRTFLNSFDWKNASDYEKVCKALELVCQAEYDFDTFEGITRTEWIEGYTTGENGGYKMADDTMLPSDNPADRPHHVIGCLVDKKCVCQGYAETLALLCRLMEMEAFPVAEADCGHAWDYVKIDGTWYTIDATNMPADLAISNWLSKPALEQESIDTYQYNIRDHFDEFYTNPAEREKIWNLIME